MVVDEALRPSEDPGVSFRSGSPVAGQPVPVGLDVWEVVTAVDRLLWSGGSPDVTGSPGCDEGRRAAHRVPQEERAWPEPPQRSGHARVIASVSFRSRRG
jgi:hypothetical protein